MAHRRSVLPSRSDSDMFPVTDDVAAKEGSQLYDGLVVLHGLPLLDCKAHYLSCLRRLHRICTLLGVCTCFLHLCERCYWLLVSSNIHPGTAQWQRHGQKDGRAVTEAYLYGHEGSKLLNEAQHLARLHLVTLAQQHRMI